MKKLLPALFLIMLVAGSAHAQWTRLDLPSGSYRDIFFSAEKTGFLVGDSGMVLKTVDDGVTWRKIDIGVNANLKSVNFPSANVGYIVGDSVFLKTVDGGESWTVQIDSQFRGLNRVNFFSENLGFVEHQYYGVLKTTDGGSTWTVLSYLSEVGIISDQFIYATTEGLLLKSLDSGRTWEKPIDYIPLPMDRMVLRFADENNGVAGCGPGINMPGFVHTSDGGKTWKSLVKGSFFSKFLLDSSGYIGKGIIDIFFATPTIGYALADSKITTRSDFGILKTKNSGADWTFLKLDTALHFYSDPNSKLYFKNEVVGYLINGKVFKTTTGGEEPVSVHEPLLKTISANISPNPFKNSARIELPENSVCTNCSVKIYDIAGRDVTERFSFKSSEREIWISEANVPAGEYVFTVIEGEKIIIKGNFLKE